MNEAIEANGIHPPIDAVYPFPEAVRAFEHLASGPFGRVVIAVR